MRHKGFTWIEGLIVVFVICVLAAILFPFFARPHEPAYRASCQSNLKQIALGILVYAQDYEEALPAATLSSSSVPDDKKYYGWADATFPYVKSHQLFQCPLEQNKTSSQDPTQQNYTDYWMNSNLSGLKLEKIKEPTTTILSGDGSDSTNARYNINALPKKWIDDKSSPAYRHVEGANYMFADGHVKWFKPEKVKTTPVSKGGPTFAYN